MNSLFYLILIGILTFCGISAEASVEISVGIDNVERIFGGERSKFVAFFVKVTLYKVYSPEGMINVGICGGTLISNHHVITAAHCLYDENRAEHQKGRVVVETGKFEQSTSSKPKKAESTNFILHEKFNMSSCENGYDIALIKLRNPWHKDIPPQSLDYPNILHLCQPKEKSGNDRYQVYGIGSTSGGTEHKYDKFVRTAELEEDTTAEKNCGQMAFDNQDKICLKSPGATTASSTSNVADACLGDSGGPAANELHRCLYGVASYGNSRSFGIGYGAIYSRISYHTDWILKNM
ncbi:trypsin-1-like isoform X1 [Convolutriloba macropyga]|uniref:trypsin-1-like isoform X1 n=1 Tax=Convolutriloba macropyga TaxID=536237 RepID=UPI003F51EFAC